MRQLFIFGCLMVLFFGFNNCTTDTQFKAGSSSQQAAGNGTPYGGNTGNGTPYGGIQKGSYFAFSNTTCPLGTEKERIDVTQNPDNSFLVVKVEPCNPGVEPVMDSEISISDDGFTVVYENQAFTHETQESTESSTETYFVCHQAGTDAASRTFELAVYQLESQISTMDGTTQAYTGVMVVEKVDFSSDGQNGPNVTAQNMNYTSTSASFSNIQFSATNPQASLRLVSTGSNKYDGSYSSSAFTSQQNQQTLNMKCTAVGDLQNLVGGVL